MGGSPTTPAVVGVLNTKFNGKVVTISQLVEVTGLEDKQIRSVMNRLSHDDSVQLDVLQRGQMWRYSATTSAAPPVDDGPTDTIFEVVGTAAKGEQIVRGDVTSRLYKVVPI